MLFLSDKQAKSNLLEDSEKIIADKKKYLENLYCQDRFSKRIEEVKSFTMNIFDIIKDILREENIDAICDKTIRLIEYKKRFIDKNIDFIGIEVAKNIEYSVSQTIAFAGLLGGIIQIENSNDTDNKIKSIKLAYDGVDRIAVAVENYIDLIPENTLIKIKHLFNNICNNTSKNRDIVELHHEGDKVLFINNSTAITRTCNSSILSIKKYLELKKRKEETINLYPSKESFEFIEKQKHDFENFDKNILLRYKGEFIYFEDNNIQDSDSNREILTQRVLERVGYRSIFITKIE